MACLAYMACMVLDKRHPPPSFPSLTAPPAHRPLAPLLQQAPRLVFMRAFAQYFDGKPSGLNPPAIIRNNLYFQVRAV